MNKGLDALLSATLDVQEEVYIPRLKTTFTIKALTEEEIEATTQEATTGRNGSVDMKLQNRLIVAKATLDPNFNDKALKAHYGTTTPDETVKKALLPGEQAKLFQAVLKLTGFADGSEEAIEDAKN